MENQHLTYFKVENFKRFSLLELNDIGQFNIIVGDNNTGKTSLLEALLVVENRNILVTLRLLWVALSSRIALSDTPTIFDIVSKNQKKVKWNWMTDELYEFSIDKGQTKNGFLLINELHNTPALNVNNKLFENYENIPFIPFGNAFTENLLKYYTSNIQNFPKRKALFIQDLKNIIEGVIDVTVDTNYDIPALKVGLEHNEMAVLLSQFGDGAIKLFRLLVDVQVYSGKHLMIDEVEAGVHWSRYKAFWKALLLSSLNSNTQLFMTTHNAECLKYLIQAVEETPELASVKEKFKLHELWEQAGDREVKADTFDYNHFKRFVENGNEVRGGSLVWH